MKLKKLWVLIMGFVISLAALTECVSAAETAGQGAVKNTLVVAQTSDAATMDPQKQGKMPDMNILINIFDTLVSRNDQGQLIPALATEWEAVDGVTWRFKLRKGVKFHNGEDFNAEAVKFTMDRYMNPETASPIAEIRNLVACSIVDEYTVDLVTSAPDPIIPNKLVLFGGVIMPPKYVQENDADTVAKNPVGTGPYKFVSWRKDAEVVLEAYDEHWRGAPAFKTLTFRVVPNWADMSAALKTGEVDVVLGLPSDLAPEIESNPGLKLISANWIRTFYVSLDTAVEPLSIKEVRQALNYAVDKQAIIENIMGGNAKQVSTVIPSQNFGYDPAIEPYPYDVEKAKKLLADAGYADGFEVAFDATANDATIVQAMISYLEAVGVKVRLNMVDAATLTSNMAAKTASPLYYQGNTGWTMDALSNYQSFARRDRRYARGGTARLDELVDIEETTIDPKLRQAAFTEAQKIMLDEAFFIYLWQQNNLAVVNANVNYTPNVIGYLWMYSAAPAQ